MSLVEIGDTICFVNRSPTSKIWSNYWKENMCIIYRIVNYVDSGEEKPIAIVLPITHQKHQIQFLMNSKILGSWQMRFTDHILIIFLLLPLGYKKKQIVSPISTKLSFLNTLYVQLHAYRYTCTYIHIYMYARTSNTPRPLQFLRQVTKWKKTERVSNQTRPSCNVVCFFLHHTIKC